MSTYTECTCQLKESLWKGLGSVRRRFVPQLEAVASKMLLSACSFNRTYIFPVFSARFWTSPLVSFIQLCIICRHSGSIVSKNAGIKFQNFCNVFCMAIRRSNQSAAGFFQNKAISHSPYHHLNDSHTVGQKSRIWARFTGVCRGRIHGPWLGDIVNSGIGLTYRPARLFSLVRRYKNPMPELTLFPLVRDHEFGNWIGIFRGCLGNLFHMQMKTSTQDL